MYTNVVDTLYWFAGYWGWFPGLDPQNFLACPLVADQGCPLVGGLSGLDTESLTMDKNG